MKNIQNKLFLLLCIALAFPHFGSSQGSLTNELSYEVNRVYPYISITKAQLNAAHTLIDLNERYKASWVSTYISVEISTSYQGSIRKAVSKNDTLSQEQKDIMNRADVGTDISVKVLYMPKNTLTYNEAKEIHFTFTVDPEREAAYVGGPQQLNQYLKDHAIDKIPAGTFKNYDFTAVKFTIDEAGHVTDAHVFETAYAVSEHEKIEELLLEAICNMPSWKPAAYANGTNVKQEFVLTVGNHENCMINLLGIRRDLTSNE